MSRNLLVAGVVGAGLWLGWATLFRSDEAQIEALLNRVATALSRDDGGDSGSNGDGRAIGLDEFSRVASLQDEFTVDATVEAGAPLQRLVGRQAIIGEAARVRGGVRNLAIRYPELSTVVSEDRQSATTLVTVDAQFDDANGARATDIREIEVQLARVNGEWKIVSITATTALRRLDQR